MTMKSKGSWNTKIDKAEKFLKDAHSHGRRVYERYRDKRDDSMLGKRVNLFYSNVHTLKESLFNSMPKVDVSRVQRGDFEDDVSRVAALVMQRGLTYEVNCAVDFQESINNAIIERLVPGIGQVWVTFDADTGDNGQVQDGTEKISVDSVYWEDFLYEPCRKWSKCGWVGRKLHLTKGEVVKAYGQEALRDIGTVQEEDGLTPTEVNKDKYCVYEIWNKKDKQVYHIYKGLEAPLKTIPDPYQLKGFFPCPRPLIANVDTTAFLPVTDYHLAQDQYTQIDNLYNRIQLIVDAIKVAGLYDAANTNIARMLQGAENKLIPVDNWAMHAERGGARGQIDWYPVEQVATVLQQLYGAFEATKAMLYEVSGMSDIIRGASNQYETAAAQEIKAQFASVRMNGYQRDVAVFVRDTMRIMGEMFSQLYSDQKIMQIIGQLAPSDMELLPQAAGILRNDLMSKYKVDVSASSLTQADWALEKGQRQELVQVIGQMVGQVSQMAEGTPELAMLGVQLIKFAVAGYKGGNEIEGWIDKQMDKMAQSAQEDTQNPQPPEPTAEEKKAQADMQKMQAEMQMDQQRMQMEMQIKQAEAQLKQQMAQFEFQHKQQMAQLEMQMAQLKLEMQMRESEMKIQAKSQEAELDAAVKSQSAAMDLEAKSASHQQKLQQSEEAAKQKTKGADS